MRYIIFDASGKIKCVASGAPPQNFCLNGEQFLPTDSASASVSSVEQWVDLSVNPPALKDKLPFPAVANKTEVIADNKDEVIISRVPLGCTCTLDGEPVTVTEELITFTAEHVGTYVFNFSMFPYLDGTITITGKAKDENTGS